MNYVIKTNVAEWRIEPGPSDSWILKKRNPVGWTPIDGYETATAAAVAVGACRTGDLDWDRSYHSGREFVLSRWEKIEESRQLRMDLASV